MHCEFIKKHEKKINYGSKGNFNKKDKFSKVYIIQGVQEKKRVSRKVPCQAQKQNPFILR